MLCRTAGKTQPWALSHIIKSYLLLVINKGLHTFCLSSTFCWLDMGECLPLLKDRYHHGYPLHCSSNVGFLCGQEEGQLHEGRVTHWKMKSKPSKYKKACITGNEKSCGNLAGPQKFWWNVKGPSGPIPHEKNVISQKRNYKQQIGARR